MRSWAGCPCASSNRGGWTMLDSPPRLAHPAPDNVATIVKIQAKRILGRLQQEGQLPYNHEAHEEFEAHETVPLIFVVFDLFVPSCFSEAACNDVNCFKK